MELGEQHNCRFNVSDDDAQEISQAFGLLRELGGGNSAKGIEMIRDNHRWLHIQRQRGDKLSAAVFFIIISTVVAGIMTAIWAGVRTLLLSVPR